jgi:hypothetical protein
MEARKEALVWLHQQIAWERRLEELVGRTTRTDASPTAAFEERLAA